MAATEGFTPCGYEIEINGDRWRCVEWKHSEPVHYLLPVNASIFAVHMLMRKVEWRVNPNY